MRRLGGEARQVRRLSFLAALLAGAVAAAVAPPATGTVEPEAPVASLVRVHTPTPADRQLVADLGLDLSEHGGPGFVDVVLHGEADADLLRRAGLDWTVRVPDLVARERERIRLDAAFATATPSSSLPSGRTAYRELRDHEFDLRELAKRNPDLVKLIRLPHRTLEGRSVLGVEVTEDVATNDGKPVLAVLGLHHAREWPSGEHTIELTIDLVRAYRAGDARVRDLLRRARVAAVPVVNPDGFVASIEGAKVVDGGEVQQLEGARGDSSLLYVGAQAAALPAYKRKNCRTVDGQPTPPGTCSAPGARHLGVDLNRNYAALWGGAGASAVAADDTYRGTAPFSEPETLNVRHLLSTRQVTMMVSNHTFGGLVLRPPGLESHGVTVDEPAMAAIGAAMAAANGSVSQPGHELYDTTGATEDWSYSATGGYGYTFELAVPEFHPPFAETVAAYPGNREAFLIALSAAADPRHHGVITADPPVGSVLRLHKRFETETSPVRTIETQQLDAPAPAGPPLQVSDSITTTLFATGPVAWHVNPSTRPAVLERVAAGTVHPATAAHETWRLSCETPAGTVLQQLNVLVGRGERVAVDLTPCHEAWSD